MTDLPATIAEIERLTKDRDAKAALLEASGASPANDPDDHYENWVQACRAWRSAIDAAAPSLLQAARERDEMAVKVADLELQVAIEVAKRCSQTCGHCGAYAMSREESAALTGKETSG